MNETKGTNEVMNDDGFRILVVAAHPDDEILGVGGTVARYVDEGACAHSLILGEGQASRFGVGEDAEAVGLEIEKLRKNTLDAADIIGYSDVYFEDFPDNRFDGVDLLDIVKVVEDCIEKVRANIVFTHFGGDLNIDHRRAFDAVMAATRPQPDNSVTEVYAFETMSSTEWAFDSRRVFSPNTFVGIAPYMEKKAEALRRYKSEIRDFPHPRSVKGMISYAQMRGSACGLEYAEAFELVRQVKK